MRRIFCSIWIIPVMLACAALLFFGCDMLSPADKAPDQEQTPNAELHRRSEWTVDVPASCTQTGSEYCYCLDCGEELDRRVIPFSHAAGEWVVIKQPDCAYSGYQRQSCTLCDKVLDTASIPSLPHTPMGSWIVETQATCSVEGRRYRECAVCENEAISEPIAKLPHTPGAWKQDVAPSCTQLGRKHAECTVCGEIAQRESIPMLGHTPVESTVPAGCLSSGSKTVRCDVCDDLLSASLIPATGHAQPEWTELPSTDSLPSAYMKFCCPKCGEVSDGKSCVNKEDVVITSGVSYQFSLSGYRVIYPAGASASFIERAEVFAERLSALTGYSISAYPDTSSAVTKEILVGYTNRTQSATALASVRGYGYTVQYLNQKIAIVGSTDLIALMGLDYLEKNCFDTARSVLAISRCAISDRYRPVTLVSAGGTSNFAVIFSKDLDATTNEGYTTSTDPENYYGVVSGTGRDYAVDAALNIVSALRTGAYSGNDAAAAVTNELLVGRVNRPQSSAVLSRIAGHQYAIAVADGKVVVTSYSVLGLQKVVPLFLDHLNDSVDANGAVVLPANYFLCGEASDEWFTDAPLPDGLTLYNTADAGDGSLQYLYMDSRVNLTAFNSYRAKLLAQGYTEVSKSNLNGSYFSTFVNTQKGTMVHVSYDAYVSAAGSNWKYATPSLRVITAYTDRVSGMINVPTATMLNPNQSYTKRTDSAIVAVPLPGGSVGTGYVMLLEDGTFIVIDGGAANGGMDNGSDPWAEVDLLWGILSELYEDVYGYAPTPSNPVHIRAWHITHSHGDHMNVFWDFAHRYGGGSGGSTLGAYAKLDYLIANVPATSMVYNTGEPSMSLRNNMAKIRGYFKGGFTYLKVHTGQTLYFANARLDVLFTHDDLNPQRIVTFNDTSTMIRFTFTPTNADGAKGSPVTFLSTGDAYIHSARWACAMFGSYLRSDMVTLSHHGGPGTEAAFYDKVAPKVLWWPHVASSVYKSSSSSGYLGSSSWYAKVDQHAFFSVSSVEYIYIASGVPLTLRLGFNGPDYDAVYDLNTKTVVSAYQLSATSKVSTSHEIHTIKPIVVKKVKN